MGRSMNDPFSKNAIDITILSLLGTSSIVFYPYQEPAHSHLSLPGTSSIAFEASQNSFKMDPSTIGCSQCGKSNIQESKFCWSCRSPIVIPESSSTAITRSTRPPPGTQVIDFTSDPESPQKGLFGRPTLPRSTSARVALRPPF